MECTRNWGEILRRTIFALAVLAACGANQLIAQDAHPRPKPGLQDLLMPHGHPRPAPANAPHTPQVVFDATSLGSPLSLDKGWRVGITADPAAANTDFDDSAWAIRDAQDALADVPDEDHHDDAGRNSGPPQNANPGPGPGHHRPFVWFRLHLKLAPNHGPIALLVELPISQNVQMGATSLGLDVFANGRKIQPEGPNREAPERFQAITRLYKLDVPPLKPR